MKVLLLNGSPRANGNTHISLVEIEKVLNSEGIETELIQVGHKAVRGCMACGGCRKIGKCVYDDGVNELVEKFSLADGLIVGSPVYYASANSTLIAVLDRMFQSSGWLDKTMKVGACLAVARRGGTTATFDELNKYFTISGMPIASGQYWNGVHGGLVGEAEKDEEGMQQMRTLAKNFTFLLKSIALGKEKYGLPEKEKRVATNFIR